MEKNLDYNEPISPAPWPFLNRGSTVAWSGDQTIPILGDARVPSTP